MKLLLTILITINFSFAEEIRFTELNCRSDLKNTSETARISLNSVNRLNNPSDCFSTKNNPLYSTKSVDDKSIVNPRPNGKFKPLPNHCFRTPQKNSCRFYEECIDERLKCTEEPGTDYAKSYGLEYCRKFSKLRPTVPPAMQEWITNTMFCLQDKFRNFFHLNPKMEGVYIFRDCVPSNPSFENRQICNQVRVSAFQSHVQCYTQPKGSFKGGICNLGDWESQLAVYKIFEAVDFSKEIKVPETRSMFAMQIVQTVRECDKYYGRLLMGGGKADGLKLKSDEKDKSFSRDQLLELQRKSRALARKYREIAYRYQQGGGDDDSISDAVRIPKPIPRKVEYKKPSGKYEIGDNQTIVIDRDTVISVEDFVVGDNVTIILKNGAQLNLKALQSKIGKNFKIVSEKIKGRDAPESRPPTLGQAPYGVQGANGKHGKAGESGSNGSDVELILGNVASIGSVEIDLSGGAGGSGQSGGHGQQGGGPRCSENAHPMFGGVGGTAGQGGFGGEGGDFRLSWSSNNPNLSSNEFNSKVKIDTSNGRGGKNGKHGNGGRAGLSHRKCCRFVLPKVCGHKLEVRGTPGRHGRYRRWDRNYDWEGPKDGISASTRSDGTTDFRFSPIVLTISSGNTSAFSKLVNQPSYSNNRRDVNGDTPLTLLFKSRVDSPIEMYEIMSSKPIDLNVLDQNGDSAIQILIRSGNSNTRFLVKRLLKDGAHLNYDDILIDVVNSKNLRLMKLVLSNKEFKIDELVKAYKKSSGDMRELILNEIMSRKSNPYEYIKEIYSVSNNDEKVKIVKYFKDLKSPLISEIALDLFEKEKDLEVKKEIFRQIEIRRDETPSDRLLIRQLESYRDTTLDYVFKKIENKPNQRKAFYRTQIKNSNEKVRLRSAIAIGETKDTESVDLLLLVLSSETEPSVAIEIARSMGELGNKKVIPVLEKLIKDDTFGIGFGSVATKAILKLQSGDNMEVKDLLKKLYDDQGNLNFAIVSQIAALGDKATPEVVKSLKNFNESGYVPTGHYMILGMIASPLAAEGLMDELRVRKRAEFLAYPIHTLGLIGDQRAIPLIKPFLNHPDESVRDSADEALDNLGGHKRFTPQEKKKAFDDFNRKMMIRPH